MPLGYRVLVASVVLAGCVVVYLGTMHHRHGAGPGAGDAVSASGRWVCDMHCEPGKVYRRAGVCPVCRMALTPFEHAAWSAVVTAVSPVIEAGRPVELSMQLLDPAGVPGAPGAGAAPGRAVRVYAAAKDSWWVSDAPVAPGADGSLRVRPTFPAPGEYALFAEVDEPEASGVGAGGRMARAILAVPGAKPDGLGGGRGPGRRRALPRTLITSRRSTGSRCACGATGDRSTRGGIR